MNTSISIIIPTYNRKEMLPDTLDGVLRQTNPNWYCIVVDDHSVDDTKSVVEDYVKKDARFSYLINERTKGAQGARNTGILHTESEWVLLLDSDNKIAEDYVEEILKKIESDPKPDIVTNYIKVEFEAPQEEEETQCYKTEGNILKALLSGKTYVDNSSACIRRQKLLDIGLLDEDCPSYQEWDTHIRLAKDSVYSYVPQCLTIYKEHKGDRISSHTKGVWANGLYVLKKHRQVWLAEVGEDIYSHFLLEILEKSKSFSLGNRLRVKSIVFSLCPKLLKQLLKKQIRR